MKFLFVLLTMLCVWTLPAANLPLDEIRKFAAEATVEKYPDADRVLISNYEVAEYDKEGLGITTDDFYEKILTEKGRREYRSIPFHFNTNYSKVEVLKLELIKPDGTVVTVDVAANSKEMTEPGQMNSNIYDPSQKVLQVSIPDLQIGDVVHTVYRETTLKSRIKGVWTEFTTLQSDVPIHYYEFVVNAPKELPLLNKIVKDEVKGSITFKEEAKGNRIIYSWTARNVPQIFDEPSMPPMYMVAQRVLLSTARDWPEISRWYWNISAPHLDKITPEMRSKVAELTKGKTTDLEKINAIFQFVSKEIRYSGLTLESESPGYEPHDVNLTFANRYGVCRDKAALLVTMLKLAGLDAYPVLFYSGQKKDEEVPNNYFNHAITAVKMKDGSYMLMDSTNETTPEIFPSYLSNMSYLVATPKGETLMTSPVIPPEQNKLRIETVGSLDIDGLLEATTTLTFGGINDDIYRGAFSSWKPEQVRQFVTRQLRSSIAGASIKELKVLPEELHDMSKPLQLVLKYSAREFLVEGSNQALFVPPWLGSDFGAVNFVLDSTGLKERKYPMKLFSTCSSDETFTLEMPVDLKLNVMPKYDKISSDILDWNQQIELKDKVITGKSHIAFKHTDITPAQYAGLKKSLARIEFEEKKTPIFQTRIPEEELFAEANAAYLDWTVEYRIENPLEWTKIEKVKKKVLKFGGIRSNSELKFGYNPVCTNLKLVHASVTQADGSKQAVTDKEINIMDEAWVGSAPRYPAAKTMVVSLPGVREGSIIEYTVESTTKNLIPFSLIELFQDFDPIVNKKLIISRPRSAEGKWDWQGKRPSNELITSSKTEDDRATFTWELSNVPAIKPETALPYLWEIVPAKQLKAGGDRDSYAAEVKEALESKVAEVDISWLKATAVQDKIREIRDFVAKNIRSAGPAFTELPLSCLTPAARTLSDGYGNSADRAILLVSLLKSAGIHGEFILASELPNLEYYKQDWNLLFMPEMYSRVLVRAGGFILNDTDQYAALGTTAHQDKLALHLASSKIDGVKGIADSVTTHYVIDLDTEGNAVITLSRKYTGMAFAARNRMYSEMTPELRKRHEQNMAAAISESAEVIEPLSVEILISRCTEKLKVKVPHFAVRIEHYLQFNLPGNIAGSLIRPLPEKREYPYFIGLSTKQDLNYEINLPKDTKSVAKMLPPDLKYEYVNVRSIDRSSYITVSIKADFSPVLLTSMDYLTLQAVQTRLVHPSMNTVLLELRKK